MFPVKPVSGRSNAPVIKSDGLRTPLDAAASRSITMQMGITSATKYALNDPAHAALRGDDP